MAASTPRWTSELRSQLKREHGFGWNVRVRNGHVQLTRRWEDGIRSSVMLPIAWDATCGRRSWRAHKCYSRPLSVRDTASLMGHNPATHHKHYGKWTDEAGLVEAVLPPMELLGWRVDQLPAAPASGAGQGASFRSPTLFQVVQRGSARR